MGTKQGPQESVPDGDAVCLICLQLYVDRNQKPLDVDCLKNCQYVFSKVAKYLSSEVFGSYLKWNFVEQGSSPICPFCFSFVQKIFKLNEMIDKLQDKIQDIVCFFTDEVLGRYSKLQRLCSKESIDSAGLVKNVDTVTIQQNSDIVGKQEYSLMEMSSSTNVISIDEDMNEDTINSPSEDLNENNQLCSGAEASSRHSEDFTHDSAALSQTENNSNAKNNLQLKEAIVVPGKLSPSYGSKNNLYRNPDVPVKELRIVLTRLNMDTTDDQADQGSKAGPKGKTAIKNNLDERKSIQKSVQNTGQSLSHLCVPDEFLHYSDSVTSDYDPTSHSVENGGTENLINQASISPLGSGPWRRHFEVFKRFKCRTPFCQFACNFSKELEAHSVKLDHKNIKHYTCREKKCSEKFFRKADLVRHSALQCIKKGSIKCSSCPKRFKRKHNVVIHQIRCRPVKLYSCDKCEKSFRRKINLTHHKNLHSKKDYSCLICNKRFVWNSSYKLHTLSEHNDGKFECKACHKRFSKRKHLMRHNITHFKSKVRKVFPCAACNSVHFAEKLWDNCVIKNFREDRDGGAICARCGKAFRQTKHLDGHVVSSGHINKRHFYCNLCKSRFHNIFTWQRHQCKHTLDDLPEGHFKCRICPKTFQSNTINEHTEWHRNPDKFACRLCKQQFRWLQNLDGHMWRIHSEQNVEDAYMNSKKTFKGHSKSINDKIIARRQINKVNIHCYKCQSQFFTIFNWRRHKCQQNSDELSDEKPFKCRICDKTFSSKKDFHEHKEWHTNPDKFKCKLCAQQYRWLKDIKKHMRVVHSEQKDDIYINSSRTSIGHSKKTLNKKHKCEQKTDERSAEKPFKCQICPKTFSAKRGATEHTEWHRNPDKFKCMVCKKQFRWLQDLRKHKVRVHVDQNGKN